MTTTGFENLNYLLNFRTSNLGLTKLDATMLSSTEDIFSYIDTKDGIIPITSDKLTQTLTESDLMKGIVFNENFFNNNTLNYILKTSISEELKNFKIGDFSHNIKRNSIYYKDNFEYTDIFSKDNSGIVGNDVIDLDVSYYASQNIIKYLFLLDTLSEFYRLAHENNGRKTDLINILAFFTIKCRYIINSSGEWELYKPTKEGSPYYYEITFSDTLKNYPIVINVLKTNEPNITVQNINSMINDFKDIFTKHINYIKKGDMMYANNFKKFYKLSKLMLNYNIIYCIKNLLLNNCSNIKTQDVYNNKCDNDILFNSTKDILSTLTPVLDPISYEYYHNHLMPSCDNNNYTCEYIVDLLQENDLPNKKPLGNINKLDITSFVKYENIGDLTEPDPKTAITTSSYRIVSTNTNKNTNSPFTSKPIGKVFTYIPSNISQISFILNDDKSLKEITGLEPKTEYFIKLHNFSTIDNIVLTDTVNNYYEWNNYTKILKIFNNNNSSSFVINQSDKIYFIKINNDVSSIQTNGVTQTSYSTSIQLPSAFTNSTLSILFTKINSTDVSILNTQPYSNTNNLVTITYTDGNNIISGLAKETGESRYFYNETDKLTVLKCSILSDDIVFDLIYKKNNYIKNFNIKVDNTKSSINPVSFEDCTYTTPSKPDDFLQFYYLPILTNFKQNVSNVLETDTKDNDDIIRTMTNLSNVNKTINKNSTHIKTNSNQFDKEHEKVLSSNKIDILSIIIFVITIFVAILLPFADITKSTLIMSAGSLFIFVLLLTIILYILVFSNYTEQFSMEDDAKTYKTEVNTIIAQILKNLYNERTRISQKVILPSLLKENKYFKEKDNRFKIYNKLSYSDLQIEERNKQRNIARITFLLNMSVILSTALLIYTVQPNLWKIILGVVLVFTIIVVFIYFTELTKVVHTNAKNIYWQKPETSLNSLNFAANSAAPSLI